MVLLEQVLLHAEEGERDAQQPKDHHGDPAGGFFAEFLQHRSGMSGRSGPVYPEWRRQAPPEPPVRNSRAGIRWEKGSSSIQVNRAGPVRSPSPGDREPLSPRQDILS